jgi:hypothetical protein
MPTTNNEQRSQIYRVIQISTHTVLYLRASLLKSAVSRSMVWSPWLRGVASEVSKPHPTWFFTCGGEGVWMLGENTNVDHLKGRISEACARITPEV